MRLIDADELAKNFAVPSNELFYAGTVLDYIKEAPTVKAEPVVHCEDCEYYSISGFCKNCDCNLEKEPDGYCDWGERRGD